MMIKRFVITLCIVFAVGFSLASERNSKIILCGKIDASSEVQNPSIHTFQEFSLSRDSFQYRYYPVEVHQDSFRVEIDCPSDYLYIRFEGFDPSVLSPSDLYLFKASDSTHLRLDPASVTFSGNNEHLINCQRIVRQTYKSVTARGRLDHDTDWVDMLFKHIQIDKKRTDSIVSNYPLSVADAKIIQANAYGLSIKRVVNSINSFCPKLGQSAITRAKDLLLQIVVDTDDADTVLIKHSINWVENKFEAIKLISRLDSASLTNYKPFVFKQSYHYINNKFNGLLREKLNVLFFLTSFGNSYEAPVRMKEVTPHVHDPLYRNILSAMQRTNEPGSKVFDFVLWDLQGKAYKLQDFKGRTVVFHFWFTGCGACIQLKKLLEPIALACQGNSNIVFVSVNVHRGVELWKKGIAGGSYTFEDDLNLTTRGMDHPLLKYYNYKGFPQMLIMDKNGKLLSSAPPRPFDEEHLLKLKKMIKTSTYPANL